MQQSLRPRRPHSGIYNAARGAAFTAHAAYSANARHWTHHVLVRCGMRRAGLQLFAFLSLALGCDSSNVEAITREDCQRVRAHAAELRIDSVKFGDATPDQIASVKAAHKENFAHSGGENYLDSCVETRDRDWLDCALLAKTLSEIEACK